MDRAGLSAGDRLPHRAREVVAVDARQRQRARHGPALGRQDAQQQVAGHDRRSPRSDAARCRAPAPAWPRRRRGAATRRGPAAAGRTPPATRRPRPGSGPPRPRARRGSPRGRGPPRPGRPPRRRPAGSRSPEQVLGLHRAGPALAGLLERILHDRPRVPGEPAEHHRRPLAAAAAAASRLACFLWTAWRVTPSASATSASSSPPAAPARPRRPRPGRPGGAAPRRRRGRRPGSSPVPRAVLVMEQP